MLRHLILKEFLQIFRNKTMLPLIFVLPVVQTLLLSFAASYEVKNLSLGVIDNDRSAFSRLLVRKFTASGYFKLGSEFESFGEAEHQFASDSVDLVLEVPVDFERNLVREGAVKLGFTISAINAQKAGICHAYAGAILRNYQRDLAESAMPRLGYQSLGLESRIEVEYSNWYNPRLDYKVFMVPGILSIIVSMVTAFLSAINLVREREKGIIDQINVSPVRKWQFILGKLLPFWIVSLLILAVGLSAGYLVFRIPIEGDLWLVFFYTAAFTPCMLGLGFLISNFADTQQQAMFSAWFFLLIFILMSGLFTPVDSMPAWAQGLNLLNPIHYFVAFMRMVLLKGATLYDIQDNLYQVLAYGIVVNVLAVITYRKRV